MQKCLGVQETGCIFPLAVPSQRNEKWKCWSQRKQSCQSNHDSLLGWPPMFSTLVHFPAIKPCLKNVSEYKDMLRDEENHASSCSLEETRPSEYLEG